MFGIARSAWFWIGCALISVGVALHLPMLAEAHAMGNHLKGMAVDPPMILGMMAILVGVPLAIFGALPPRVATHGDDAGTSYEASDDTQLNRHHAAVLVVLIIGLVIDTMKPATLGLVLPGLRDEYGIAKPVAAWLPFVALTGTTIGSFVWGWVADRFGRRSAIMLSTILFVATSICGAMPDFRWNLLMCFLMGCSAGGMLPVVYTLLAEIMPPKHRTWVLVLVGGLGLVGGTLAANGAASLFEATYGWRSLWLQGFPTGLLLLALARWIPESPRFLVEQGRQAEVEKMMRRFGIVRRGAAEAIAMGGGIARHKPLTVTLVGIALLWSIVNFGVLLWLPTDFAARGIPVAVGSALIAKSSLLALPTIALFALGYHRWSSKKTLVAAILLTLTGLCGALLPASALADRTILVLVVALLVVGVNGLIAVLLPYTAENYPLGVRGRATGLVAGASKVGGVTVQAGALAGIIPTLGGTALLLVIPMGVAALATLRVGRETRGRSLADLERGSD